MSREMTRRNFVGTYLSTGTALIAASMAPSVFANTSKSIPVEQGSITTPNGLRIAYERQRNGGHPVLLIPGTMCDRGIWRPVQEAFQRFDTILLDNRDSGQSSLSPSNYTLRDMAEDALALLDELRIERVHLVGHSMGGQIAQELALMAPARVSRMLLANTWARTDDNMNAMFDSWEVLRNYQSDEAFAKSMTIYGNGSSTLSRRTVDELLEASAKILAPQEPAAFLRNVEADRKADTLSRLGEIKARTLVLWSEEDRCLLPPHAKQLEKGIPGAKSVRIRNCGHNSMGERSNVFMKIAEDFLI
ncbi:alpha/beta hydrolase [Pseudomonas paraeruginosa]|uniref:alpha/beta fold hydrolase n=1 Tax=Pseudomonas aeruginosa group TaxID=136841 RepID=UPI001163618B|nr:MULTISPECIES: alpha/beta hydrolase [Pseudomonas aeruginosa group]MBG4066350.1 alpha/beta hydrolase [Pseudomonas aeruginosa]MBG5599763.1 alpha/beta hydrolase [Pseudomonas aeruginosa]MBH3670964.1 alpha/beta hydrolase [Pseudomonas aeruginosa]MBH9434375.1 alpha/beta hydrolase [Pseudomonas aeruginosa]MBI8817970.1 alpha/beta hydrolase [Pseudomonas aeruginosa]